MSLQAYPVYVEQIEVQAEHMLQFSIFNDPHSFSYRNIMKTPPDFEKVKQVPLQLGLDYGVVSGTSFRMTDMMMMFILIMLCIFIFHTEREQGQILLLRTMKHGRRQLFHAKLQLLFATSCGIALLFYGSILLLANNLYGFGDGARYIQSMGAYKFANLPLTVNEYLSLFVVGKAIICVIIALFIALIFLLLNHLSRSLVILALLFSTSYLAYHFIHESSYLNVLKYINIIALSDISRVLTHYVNLNILGYPVTYIWVALFVSGLLAVLLLVGCSLAYPSFSVRLSGSSTSWWRTIVQSFTTWLHPLHNNTALIWHESMKQWCTAKGWVIVVVALLISAQDIRGANLVMDHNQYYYNHYMEQLSGPLSEDKIAYIEQEQARRNNVGAELHLLITQYRANEISPEQLLVAQAEAEQLKLSAEAFDQIYDQYLYLSHVKQINGIDPYFVNLYAAHYLFNNANHDQMNIMIIGLLLAIYLSSVYTVDFRQQMLLKTTKRGRMRLFTTVWLYGLGVATLKLFIMYIPQYLNTARLYPGMIEWQAPVQSLEQFEHLPLSITLQQLTILVSWCQWVGIVAISIILLLMAQLLRRFPLTLLSGIVLIVSPTFATWLGFHIASKYTLHYPQLMYQTLGDQYSSGVLTYYLVLTVLLSGCLWFTWRYYKTGEIRGGMTWARIFTKSNTEREVELD